MSHLYPLKSNHLKDPFIPITYFAPVKTRCVFMWEWIYKATQTHSAYKTEFQHNPPPCRSLLCITVADLCLISGCNLKDRFTFFKVCLILTLTTQTLFPCCTTLRVRNTNPGSQNLWWELFHSLFLFLQFLYLLI